MTNDTELIIVQSWVVFKFSLFINMVATEEKYKYYFPTHPECGFPEK